MTQEGGIGGWGAEKGCDYSDTVSGSLQLWDSSRPQEGGARKWTGQGSGQVVAMVEVGHSQTSLG